MNPFKKIFKKIMELSKNKELLLNEGDSVNMEVIDRIESDTVHFKSGRSMNANEVKQIATDPTEGLFEKQETAKMPVSKNKPKKRPLYPESEEYGGLKKLGKSQSSGKGGKDDDTKDDGKPHKARSGVIKLNEEIDTINRKNQQLRRKIKSNKNKINPERVTEGLNEASSTTPANPNASVQQSQPQVAPPQKTKLESLLKEDDNYEDVTFDIPIKLSLPPRKALRQIEEFFDINMHEELSIMLSNSIKDIIHSDPEGFKELIEEQIEKHLYPRGR